MLNINFLDKPIKNTAIIMRHADREHIKQGVNEDEPINEAGRINSIELGEKLALFNSVKIFTSPIGRCIQTGEAILQGFKKQGCTSESSMLGEPGPFVFDRKLASKVFNEYGCIRTVENQIAGQRLEGVRSVEEGGGLLKNYVLSEMQVNNKENLLIFITHDAILAPFIYLYTGEKFNKEHWVDFLDGVIFIKENENVQLIRNGEKYAVR